MVALRLLRARGEYIVIQYCRPSSTGWTGRSWVAKIRDMLRRFQIEKLSDEFGQYTLILKCAACGHERTAQPHTLARLCGWDARLEEVEKRMRCSKCGKKNCNLKASPSRKPRGYPALPR